jgi:TPR repeat protein
MLVLVSSSTRAAVTRHLWLASFSLFMLASLTSPGLEASIQVNGINPATLDALIRAANDGLATAEDELGVCYRDGRGVDRDVDRAFEWFKRAANQGLANAAFHLGESYANGVGTLQDAGLAFQWYLAAASRGHAQAQFAVGNAYSDGIGAVQDDSEAFRWYFKSAAQDYAPAQLAVGFAYLRGRGVTQSDDHAFPWLERAAQQGLAEAQYWYGMRHPVGSPQDDIAVAVDWFRKAAEQGYPPAQLALASVSLNAQPDNDLIVSKHVVRDIVAADAWLIVCATRATTDVQSRCATLRDNTERDMSPNDRLDAEQRALDWIKVFESRSR